MQGSVEFLWRERVAPDHGVLRVARDGHDAPALHKSSAYLSILTSLARLCFFGRLVLRSLSFLTLLSFFAISAMHRIVCGIDFGTTYTAVAWTETSNPTHIEVIQNWPTSGQLVGNQVPSEIAYKDGDTTTFSWGYDIPPTVKKVTLTAPLFSCKLSTNKP